MKAQLITSERQILRSYANSECGFSTDIKTRGRARYPNPASEKDLGLYRPRDRRKYVTADAELIDELSRKGRPIPGFLEAGPREKLVFDTPKHADEGIRAALVTTGGLAPGLNSVIHSIVERHVKTYHKLVGGGGVWGFFDSFKGLTENAPKWKKLDTNETETWLEKAGCELGAIRYEKETPLHTFSQRIADNLEQWHVDILYIIGGDGSLATAHEIASRTKKAIVVGIPKTMDNDILWVWQSFGFNTAVERAASFVNTIHAEVESTRRVCALEFFGARSGFVAANAALASGHVDLVIIPEVFERMTREEGQQGLIEYAKYLERAISRKQARPHGVIVIAEGVGEQLAKLGVELSGEMIERDRFPDQFLRYVGPRLINMYGEQVSRFVLHPRYYVRASAANAHDQIYCKRLGALAVDNALAGYTDFMISQWLTEYVLVPLELVAMGQKRVPPAGIFWKQVVASTGQPPME